MSLKHKNFNESIIMQSYLNKALEKGLLKSEDSYDNQFIKSAAASVKDNKLSENLNDNILKLCTKLRNSGFESYADDLERNFLSYKFASKDFYDVSKETGEDVINAAHPDGSKKIIEESTGDMGVVRTLIDSQKKIQEVVKKQPSGKLALNLAAAIVKSSSDNHSSAFKRFEHARNTINFYQKNLGTYLNPQLNTEEKRHALGWLTSAQNFLNKKYFSKSASNQEIYELEKEIELLEDSIANFKTDYLI
jgi:hypothetical protein